MTSNKIKIDNKYIGDNNPVYFIADVAANHDGDLNRAKDLIYLAADAGADAAKFQHFKAETIVSDHGFRSLEGQQSHQAKWKKSVFEVYKQASISLEWTEELRDTCKKAGITFFTSPYSKEIVDYIDPYVPAHKIGSGDITWIEMIEHIASKGKPYILATGASNLEDVRRAVSAGLAFNSKICVMQCNTNYTASLENFHFINLNVLKTYHDNFPDIILGLSDHTPGHTTVLGAVAFGAKMIEKHFTDDTKREGPDHKFSLDPTSWKEMVGRTRELENAIGNGSKNVENNEKETVVLQRRSIRLSIDMPAGSSIQLKYLDILRPCPIDAIPPYEVNSIIGRKLLKDKSQGEYIKWTDIE